MIRKAFTLLELVVSLGILAVMLVFASTIFRVSVNSQRLSAFKSPLLRKKPLGPPLID